MPDPTKLRPVVLAILDGYGESPIREHNAVAQANKPNIDALKARYPHGVINASELHVGLPHGQMGNSEVGHMNIGSGRVVMQELPRIDKAVEDGSLTTNPELLAFIARLKESGGVCHLLGLLSDGGVHSHLRHMAALARIVAAAGIQVCVHAFFDGRDTPPKSAMVYIAQFRKDIGPQAEKIHFATGSGRYFAMDRDNRWERVSKVYRAMVERGGNATLGIENVVGCAYDLNKTTDEFIPPNVIDDYKAMQDGDGLLMANFRTDRAREILQALLDPDFTGFERKRVVKFAAALGMVEYSSDLNRFMTAIFKPDALTHILAEVLADQGRTQLHIAETEKYAHVTFFFNGGREEPFPGETRILVPSPKVATYDLQPEMSAPEITNRLVAAIAEGGYDFIVVNYANTDMVGHTGNLDAAIKAVETVDSSIGRIWAALNAKGGALLITADHGNAEQMHDDHTHQPHTAHTLNLVPMILAVPGREGQAATFTKGRLADIAPTVLKLLGIAQPMEMTGKALI